MLGFPEYTGAAQVDCASAILQVAAVLYKGAFSLNKSLRKRCKLNHIYVAQRQLLVVMLIVKMIFLSTVRNCETVTKFFKVFQKYLFFEISQIPQNFLDCLKVSW